jgi:hypothetical protein
LTTYKGPPGNAAALFAVEVNDVPVFFLILLSDFAADGNFVVSATVPPGIPPLGLTLVGLGVGIKGGVSQSNRATVTFQ